MELFLAAQAQHPETQSKLQARHTEPLNEKKIAYIPTASNAKNWGAWRTSAGYQTALQTGAEITVTELETMSRPEIERAILGADIIWVGGGQPGYLLYWLRRHFLDEALTDLFHNDPHKLYVGSSAGSMIFSPEQTLAGWEINGETPERDIPPGLGLINFEIFPHYDESLLPEIKKLWVQGALWLLKNGDVIVVNGEKTTVLGQKNVLIK
jgi:peptidase E